MTTYSLKYNDVSFSGVIVERIPFPFAPPPRDSGMEMTARDGGFAGRVTYGRLTIVVPVVIVGEAQTSPAATARANYLARLDALKLGLNTRLAAKLEFDAITDRYWLARFAGADEIEAYVTWGRTNLTFICDDPFAFASAETTSTISVTTDTHDFSLTAAGSGEAKPVYEIDAGVSGAGVIVLEHEGRGELLSWNAALAYGQTLRIDCAQQMVEVTATGEEEWTSSMLNVDGVFPMLAPGANAMVLHGAGGATLRVAWRDRYL